MEEIKVVTAQEMARIEKGAISRGASEEKFMERAGQKISEAAIEYIETHRLPKRVTLLVGRGNNGGDAYAAGICLLEKGFKVSAFPTAGACSPLNRKFGDRFRKKGKVEKKFEGLILDGLLGTGFKGRLDAEMSKLIQQANRSGPILAIDIPSGLNGTTGEAEGAIVAVETIALGLPKIGFFLRDGWNHVGQLRVVDFGLPKEAVAEAEAVAYMAKDLHLPKIVRNRHKYQAGYVVGYGGSKALPGAAKLAGLAALKAGAGIVKLFHSEEIGPGALELICTDWNEKCWKMALEKAQAVFVGPGLERTREAEKWLQKHLKEIKQPCVIDAGALLKGLTFPKNGVLTPHRGEMLRLLGLKAAPREEELFAKIIRFCERQKVVLVLKGAPTFVFGPKKKPVVITRGDPGMATAGSGDVLTGMLAALLAQGCSPYEGAILGAALHGIAGEAAAKKKTSYCLMASDLIEFMPAALWYCLNQSTKLRIPSSRETEGEKLRSF